MSRLTASCHNDFSILWLVITEYLQSIAMYVAKVTALEKLLSHMTTTCNTDMSLPSQPESTAPDNLMSKMVTNCHLQCQYGVIPPDSPTTTWNGDFVTHHAIYCILQLRFLRDHFLYMYNKVTVSKADDSREQLLSIRTLISEYCDLTEPIHHYKNMPPINTSARNTTKATSMMIIVQY